MRLFNFGIPELLMILALMVIFMGPERMIEGARKLGSTIYRITHSEVWSSIWQTSREIRQMPKTIVEETGLQESLDDINATNKEIQQDIDGVQKDIDGIKLETGQELKKSESDLKTLTKHPPTILEKSPRQPEASQDAEQTPPDSKKPTTLEK